MKNKTILLFAAIVLAVSTLSCSSPAKADVYACPMKCSEQKSDKPDKCEVCGMDLEKVTES